MNDSARLWMSRATVALLVLLAASLPLWASGYHLQLATTVLIFAIFAMSLDLLVGVCGLVSLGHAAFFGCSAYLLVRLGPEYDASNLLTSLPLAVGGSALLAFVIGAFSLRTRGIYFIMVTLAFGQMAYYVAHDTPLGGGSDGVYLFVRPQLAWGERLLIDLESPLHFFLLSLVLAVAVYALLRRLLGSPFGQVLAGIRVNEHRMKALGYATYGYKLAAFTASGALAGIAGYLSACQFGFVNPEILSWHQSGLVLMMVILGGKGHIRGAVLGAAVFVALEEVLADAALVGPLADHWQLALGLLIIAIVLFAPRGLAGIRLPRLAARATPSARSATSPASARISGGRA